MSGGHQLQLAVLWPWLLMTTLHAGFGHTGLVLAAAVESERSEQKAIIRVIPLKMDPTGKLNLTLEGVFAGVAEVTPAEGKLMQASITCSGLLSICLKMPFLFSLAKSKPMQGLPLLSFVFIHFLVKTLLCW